MIEDIKMENEKSCTLFPVRWIDGTGKEGPIIKLLIPPEVHDWEPKPEEEFFVMDNDVVIANYEQELNINPNSNIQVFIIKKNHYKDKMPDILKHLNYFLTFFDPEKELYMAILRIKWNIDKNECMSVKSFRSLIMGDIMTPSIVSKIKDMAKYLYRLDIDTDKEGKYRSTPKVSNDQARLLLAMSFAFRLLMPICVHFSNVNVNFTTKKAYIRVFSKIYMDTLIKFEEDDTPVYSTLCEFIEHRNTKNYKNNLRIWGMKKQIRGITAETHLEDIIQEVIIVKSIYKLDSRLSAVAFIDGIVGNDYKHFKNENFKLKPIIIDSDGTGESDDYLSKAEGMEMASYRIDESNVLLSEANAERAFYMIHNMINVDVTDEEYDFYKENCALNYLTERFMHSFYSKYFDDTNAIYTLSKSDSIVLLILMKKFLIAHGMRVLPLLITSKVNGKFKENIIRNRKFIEKYQTTSVYRNILEPKFKYARMVSIEDDNTKLLSTIINSSFTIVDWDPLLCCPSTNHDVILNDVDSIDDDIIIDEFSRFSAFT